MKEANIQVKRHHPKVKRFTRRQLHRLATARRLARKAELRAEAKASKRFSRKEQRVDEALEGCADR